MVQRLVTPFFTLLLVGVLFISGVLDYPAEATLDTLFTLRGERQTSQEIVIVGIDDTTLRQLGSWPFPRAFHAELLDAMGRAKAIIFDLLFTETAADDARFAQAIAQSPPVIFGTARDFDGRYLSPAPLLQDHVLIGSIETVKGKRGIVRKAAESSDVPALSQAVLTASKEEGASRNVDGLINFYGPEFTFLYVPYIDVIEKKLPEDFFQGRYVFVGAQALGMGDVHATPFSLKRPTPGVEIQATLLNNLLDGTSITDRAAFALGLAFFMLIVVTLFTGSRELWNLFGLIFLSLFLFAVSYFLFLQNSFLNISLALIVLYLGYVIHLCFQMIWVNRSLLLRVVNLDRALGNSLQSLYYRIPRMPEERETGEIEKTGFSLPVLKKHIVTLEDTVSALTLQSQFVNHLLRDESAPLAIWSGNGGQLFFSNSALVKLWKNIANEDIHAVSFSTMMRYLNEHLAKGQYELTLSQIDRSTAETPTVIEISVVIKGLTRNFNVSLQSIRMSESTFTGYMAGFSDVTRIRQIERVKSDVLSIMSHELKLPLTTILGYSELLEGTLPPEQSNYVKEISEHSRKLNSLIESFLNLERLESGKLGDTPFPCDLAEIVTDAVAAASQQAALRNIDISFQIPNKVSPVMGDEVLLLQVFLNLLDNAVKFSLEGQHVQVNVFERADEIEVAVRDEGIGIPEEMIPVIFDRFSRVEGNKAEGFGLGLSFVKQVVENHNGQIRVMNNTEEGVCFSVILPKLLSL